MILSRFTIARDNSLRFLVGETSHAFKPSNPVLDSSHRVRGPDLKHQRLEPLD